MEQTTNAGRSVANGNTHVAGGAFDDAHRRLNTGAVEVGELGLGDLLKLGAIDGANTAISGLTGTLLNSSGLGNQNRGRRGFGDEGETAVFEDRNFNRNHVSGLVLGASVVLLAERHDVDPVLTEGRTHRRCGVGFAGLKGQLDHSYDFLGHRQAELNICGSPAPEGGAAKWRTISKAVLRRRRPPRESVLFTDLRKLKLDWGFSTKDR